MKLLLVILWMVGAAFCNFNPSNEACICTMIYMPVCGKDGKTYGNKCTASCANVEVAFDGECNKTTNIEVIKKTPRDNCICTKIYLPVCGKDGKTYGNKCTAKCANVEVAFNGKCPEVRTNVTEDIPTDICICTKIYLPVCGRDGKTYGNSCTAKCANVEVVSDGECPPIESV